MIESFLASASAIAIAKVTMAFMPFLFGVGGAGSGASGYKIERSVRLRASTAKFQRAVTSGDQATFTISAWVKGIDPTATYAPVVGDPTRFVASGSGTINMFGFTLGQMTAWIRNSSGSDVCNVKSTHIFRDPSAWYHCVWVMDGGNTTAADRQRMYVNGPRLTALESGPIYTAGATNAFMNNGNVAIGAAQVGATVYYSSLTVANVHIIVGQALEPDAFGELDALGNWVPKEYENAYGANDVYLKFSDNSAATAAAIGADSSGNANNYTPTAISVTADSTNDSLVDTPTNYGADTGLGGEVRGNYCTMNPFDAGSSVSLSEGNLKLVTGTALGNARATFGMSSGKWYWEATEISGSGTLIGIAKATAPLTSAPGAGTDGWGLNRGDGKIYTGGVGTTYGTTFTTNDVLGFAYNADTGELFVRKNGVWMNSGDPVAGTNPATTGLSGELFPAVGQSSGSLTWTGVFNFGQRPFTDAAPTGFKCLCAQNLPDPAIKKPSDYFSEILWTGTGGSRAFTGIGFQPDLVWTKNRSIVQHHQIYDSVRGVAKRLQTSDTSAEASNALNGYLSSFDSDGFSTTAGSSDNGWFNNSGNAMVAWCWKEGLAYQAIAYVGTGAQHTINHDLGVAPSLVIVKNRSTGSTLWPIWHADLASTEYLQFTTAAKVTDATRFGAAPTSSSFSVGSSSASNASGDQFIAYLFAEVPGFSKIGSYTGNGGANGPFVYCGFRPRWILLKRSNAVGDWWIYDTIRDVTQPLDDALLYANLSNAENASGTNRIDVLSNGFKLRDAGGDNTSGGTYIFMAFAETPFKYARAR